jgi:transposase InsO family protein
MVDDRTRLAYAEIHDDDRAATAVALIQRALAWFAACGVAIERVMTDNGSCYRSRAFRGLLAEHGITHKRTRPYRPQTNGKVERLNLTLEHEWAYIDAYTSNQQRRHAFDGYLHYYNYHRPHSGHGGKPPMAALTGTNAAGSYS